MRLRCLRASGRPLAGLLLCGHVVRAWTPARATEFLERLRSAAYDNLEITAEQAEHFSRVGVRHAAQGWTNVQGIRKGLQPLLSSRGSVFTDMHGSRTDMHVVVIEVGAWRGGSAIAIADALKGAFPGAKLNVVSVDTWLGAPEFWFECCYFTADRGGGLQRKHGYPSVFYNFTRNLKLAGHSDVSAPLPLSSLQAVDVLHHWGVQAQAIYIDGAHKKEPAYEDMRHYWRLLEPGGILFGDDASNPGVFSAIVDFQRVHASEIARPYNTSGTPKVDFSKMYNDRKRHMWQPCATASWQVRWSVKCFRKSVWSLEKQRRT